MSATPQYKSFSWCGCSSFVVGLISLLAIAGIFVELSWLLFGKEAAFEIEARMKLMSATPYSKSCSCCGLAFCRDLQLRLSLSDSVYYSSAKILLPMSKSGISVKSTMTQSKTSSCMGCSSFVVGFLPRENRCRIEFVISWQRCSFRRRSLDKLRVNHATVTFSCCGSSSFVVGLLPRFGIAGIFDGMRLFDARDMARLFLLWLTHCGQVESDWTVDWHFLQFGPFLRCGFGRWGLSDTKLTTLKAIFFTKKLSVYVKGVAMNELK